MLLRRHNNNRRHLSSPKSRPLRMSPFLLYRHMCVVCTQIRPAGHRRQYQHLFALRAQYNNYTAAARCVYCSFYYDAAGNKNVFSVLLLLFFF